MKPESDVYLNTLNRMEPDIAAVDLTGAAASIAISLKRIADALENTEITLREALSNIEMNLRPR